MGTRRAVSVPPAPEGTWAGPAIDDASSARMSRWPARPVAVGAGDGHQAAGPAEDETGRRRQALLRSAEGHGDAARVAGSATTRRQPPGTSAPLRPTRRRPRSSVLRRQPPDPRAGPPDEPYCRRVHLVLLGVRGS